MTMLESHADGALQGRRRTWVAALSLLMMSAACERSDPATTAEPNGGKGAQAAEAIARPVPARPRNDGADPYMATLARAVAVPEALLTGALRVRHKCLVFDSGGQVSLALVPAGTRLDGRRGEIAIGAATLPLGKELQFGGGSYPAGHEVFDKLADPVPEHCPRSGTLIGDLVR
jgi:hypothetical protein